MDEAEGQGQDTQEEEMPSQPTQGAKAGKKSSVTTYVAIGVCAVLIIMALGVGFGFMRFDLGEPTPDTGGNVTCNGWVNAPLSTSIAINKAAKQVRATVGGEKINIQPALIAAILLSENADAWPPASKVQADGPFQITDWNTFWNSVVTQGFDSRPTADVNNIYDSALATGANLKTAFDHEKIPLNTTEQKYIMYAFMYHNRGSDAAYKWADGGYDMNNAPINNKNPGWEWGARDYVHRAWSHFQDLQKGCQDISTGGSIVEVALKEIGTKASPPDCVKYNLNGKCQKWCAAFVSYVYQHAGYKLPTIYSAQALLDYMHENQWAASRPKSSDIRPGDMVFFPRQKEADIAGHVGIVKMVNGNKVITIEGNTGSDRVSENNRHVDQFLAVARWKS